LPRSNQKGFLLYIFLNKKKQISLLTQNSAIFPPEHFLFLRDKKYFIFSSKTLEGVKIMEEK
jgi:hypothetical protein